MRKLRVLHAITNMRIGGAENLVCNILQSIDNDKFEPYLLLFEENGMYYDAIVENKYITLLKLKTPFRRFNFFLLLEVILLLKQNKIDIVHTHLYKSNLYVRLAAAICGCRKVIFHEHGGILMKPLRHRICEAILQYVTDCFIFISQHDRDYFRSHSWLSEKSRMVVLNNPCVIEGTKSTPRVSSQIVTIGMVGQLNQMKGHIYCLQALAMLQKRGVNLDVYLVGDGAEKYHLEEFCRAHAITAHFPGNVLDVSSYYEKFDVFIHPSLSEGFGMVIVEAMSFGLPVIATNVGGIPEIITNGQNGLLVEPSSAEAIENVLSLLISDKELNSRLSKNALKTYSEKYTFRKYIQQLEAIYSERDI